MEQRLDQLKFKAMLTDKPHYIALFRRRLADLADRNSCSRDRQRDGFETRDPASGTGAEAGAGQGQSQDRHGHARGLARIGIQIATENRKAEPAQGPQAHRTRIPGPTIEAQFRSFQALVNGPAGRRPIDALTQNFRDIHQSLQLERRAVAD